MDFGSRFYVLCAACQTLIDFFAPRLTIKCHSPKKQHPGTTLVVPSAQGNLLAGTQVVLNRLAGKPDVVLDPRT